MATARSTDSNSNAIGLADATASGADRRGRSRSMLRSGLAVIFAIVVAAAAMLGTTQAPASAAVGPGVTEQCNGIENAGGRAVECEVTVTNYLDVTTGLSSSTIVARACVGAANAEPTCTVTPITFPTATTVVNQCNASGQGGGATVTCEVRVVNNIIGDTTLTPATVNQCVGSGAGGGTEPTLDCSPGQSTTNATITQCNGAANGGGGTRRVTCVVDPSTQSTALPVTITQCNNGNVTAPGSYVTCTASLTHRLLPVGTVIPTPTPTATPTGTPTPTATPTGTPTPTATPTSTPTPSPSVTPSATPVPTPTVPAETPTPTPAPTETASPVVPVVPASPSPTPSSTSPASPLIPAAGTEQGGGLGAGQGAERGAEQGTELAETGVDPLPVFLIAAGALLVGGILIAVMLVRRRTGQNPTRRS